MSSPSRVLPQLVMVLALGAGLVHAQAPPTQTCPAEQKNARLPDLRFASQYYQMAYQAACQPTVVMEIHVLHVSDDLFDDFVQSCKLKKQHSLIVDECSATAFLKQVQDDEDSWVVAAPTLSTFSGQPAHMQVGEQQNFVTDMDVVRCANQTAYVPRSEPVHTGCTMCVCPAVTPDGQNVILHLEAECAELPDGDPPMFPVTTVLTPIYEGGAVGQAVPFTQYLQQPMVTKRCMTAALGVPVGKTAMIYGGHSVQTVHDVSRVPVLSDLPLIGCLFENVDERDVSDHLIYMITPRVVHSDEDSCAHACHGCCPNGPCHATAAAQSVQVYPTPCGNAMWCVQMPVVPVAGVCQVAGPLPPAPPLPPCAMAQLRGQVQILPGVNFEICMDRKNECQQCPASCGQCPAQCEHCPLTCPAGCPQCPAQCAQCPMACSAPCAQCPNACATTCAQCPTNGNCCAANPVTGHAVSPPPQTLTYVAWQANQTAPAANCCPAELTLPVLLKSYREACAAGRMVEARVLAERCLQLDPTCFGRN